MRGSPDAEISVNMNDTPNLALPYILASQAQKHVTHNEAVRALDCLVQLAVESRALTAPPPVPVDGSRFVVAASATGDWEGQSGRIAAFQDGAWAFYEPKEGWTAWVADEHALIIFDAHTWTPFAGTSGGSGGGGGGLTAPVANSDLANMASGTFKARASAGSGHAEDLTGTQATALLDAFVGSGASHKKGLVPDPGAAAGTAKFLREDGSWAEPPAGTGGGDPGAITELDNVNHVGINATGDTTNRLSLKSPASLFDHEGNGHQVKINKRTDADTASVLYQTNYSGRAEIGLTGNDDFHFKVSADGSSWHEAIVIDRSSGRASFPNTSSLPSENFAKRAGGFEIWQRLTNGASTIAIAASTTAYTVDGWYLATGANQACTLTEVAGITNTSQFAAKVQRNSGQTGTGTIRFAMPLDLDEIAPLRGSNVCLSFTLKEGANQSFSHAVAATLYCGTGAVAKRNGTAYTGETSAISLSCTTTTTATRFQATSAAVIPIATTQMEIQFAITPTGTAGADDSFSIDDLKLEIVANSSATATPYISELAAEVLPLCQKFLPVWNHSGANGEGFGFGGAINTTTGFAGFNLMAKARVAP